MGHLNSTSKRYHCQIARQTVHSIIVSYFIWYSTSNEKRIIQELHGDPIIEIQYLNKLSNNKLITIVSDARLSLAIEVNDDTAKTTNEAIGLASYYNSESTVLSYVSIFDILWIQSELKGK